MKNLYLKLLPLFLLFTVLNSRAQEFKGIDKSPHDIVYYRVNKITPPDIKVLYGRPQMKGRKIFGELVPYGKIWRTGADEATEITFYKDVNFGGKNVKKGSYVLYTIPGEKEWIVILNKNLDAWGTNAYDKRKDVVRVPAKVSRAESVEAFSIGFKKKKNKVNMIFGWDTTRATVPIEIH
jgi:hypothetical protein